MKTLILDQAGKILKRLFVLLARNIRPIAVAGMVDPQELFRLVCVLEEHFAVPEFYDSVRSSMNDKGRTSYVFKL